MVQYGETEWDDKGKSEFIRLKDGTNKIRLFTKPFKFGTHRVHFPDDPTTKNGGGRIVRCAVNDCSLCALAKDAEARRPKWAANLEVDKQKSRWYVGAISRDEQKAGILEIGSLIRNKVKEFAGDENWGNPARYDLTVKKDPVAGKESPMLYYAITPNPATLGQLSDSDQELIEKFNVAALVKRCEPVSNEDVERAVLKYRNDVDEQLKKARGKTAERAEKVEDKDEADEDQPNLVFKKPIKET